MAFVLERHSQFNSYARIVFHNIKQDINKNPENRMGSIVFSDSIESIPLQAADLLLDRVRKRVRTIETTGNVPDIGTWDKELGAGESVFAKYHGPKTLKEIADKAEIHKKSYLPAKQD